MAYFPNNPNGQATSANSAPVVISSDQSAVPIADGGGSLTVDGSVTVSGTVTANAGTGTMNVSVQNASIPVTDNGGSLTVDGTVTVSQSTAANLNATVVGTGTFVVQSPPHSFGFTLIHKDGEYSTTQTGAALWTPASGKKFVVTDLTISTGGTTAGIVTLWQGASGDTTYTVGTDPAIFRGEFAPSTTAKPGAVKSFNVPYISTTADHILRVTTSAAMTIYVQVNGYEI